MATTTRSSMRVKPRRPSRRMNPPISWRESHDCTRMIVDVLRRFFAARDIAPCSIVAAVSGGADSTALLIALVDLRFDVVAAHVNHHLRGYESDGDEAFVRELCERLRVALEVADGTLDPDDVKRIGIEAAAREVRTRLLLDIK